MDNGCEQKWEWGFIYSKRKVNEVILGYSFYCLDW